MRTIKFIFGSLVLGMLAACDTATNATSKTLTIDTLTSPADTGSVTPYLYAYDNKGIYLSWIEKKEGNNYLKYAAYNNGNWTPAATIHSGNNWFVNWADYPLFVANDKGHMLSHYLEKSATGTYTYDIKMLASADNGKQWSPAFLLHDDGKQAEHGFVSMVPYGEHFFVSWLDGRNTAMPEGMDHQSHDGHSMGAMTLRAAIVDISGKKINEWELDDRVCDCCQTNAAITNEGPVVVYRDRSEDELRDISIVRYVNGKWTEPQVIHADNWNIKGCPVNGPRITARGKDVAVAWFTGAGGQPQVQMVFSADGGATFGVPVRIDEGKSIGRVDVEWLNDEQALVSWMEGADIRIARVNSKGQKEASITIASSSSARSSGFPQMAKSGNNVYFAWVDDDIKKVKMAKIKL